MPLNAINVILALMIIVSFLGALVIHECGHALMASWLGDPTPRRDGRQSLSLRPHLDALGLLLCIILAFMPALAGPMALGWGKPVKSDPWKLHGGPNVGTLIVALAGMLSSLLIGILVAVVLRFVPVVLYTNDFVTRIPQLLAVFASVNICLAIFNLLPLYPLDGYQIVYTLLPSRQAVQFAKSAPYGPFIILAVFFLLPFLAQFAGLGSLPIFHIPQYIWQGSLAIISMVTGPLPLGFNVSTLYLFRLILPL
jgi:Zn-dependent protease